MNQIGIMRGQIEYHVPVEKKGECLLDRLCNSKNIVYQACISPMEHSTDGKRIYIYISAGN